MQFSKSVLALAASIVVLLSSGGCNLLDQLPGIGKGDDDETSVTKFPSAGHALGDSCRTSDTSFTCLALRYVVYKDANGAAIVGPDEVIANLATINSIWRKCNIAFQIDDYTVDNAGDHQGLKYATDSFAELDRIRGVYGEGDKLLVATTGTWAGALGDNPANAWTAMPGGGPFGSILERPVGKYPYIIAHELGHYLNLLHVNDTNDLMNPTIYTYSTNLYDSQCASAHAAINSNWSRMVRR